MINKPSKSEARIRKHARVRKRISGTTERPRLAVYKSLKHFHAQIIDDTTGTTLVSASTLDKAIAGSLEGTGNVAAAAAVGKLIAERALEKNITTVVFDKGGFLYQGRIQASAEAAREAGLQF